MDSDSSHAYLVNSLINSNLHQLITEPTRFRQNQTPSTLDLLFTNDTELVSRIGVESPIGRSDHAVLECNIQVLSYQEPKNFTRSFAKIDSNSLKNALNNIDWNELLQINDPSNAWQRFHTTVQKAVADNTTVVTQVINPKKPWINSEMISRSRRKRNLWRKFKNTQSPTDFEVHRHFSNTLSQDLKIARRNYENALLNKGPKAIYKYTRNNLSSKVGTPVVKKDDGSLCDSNYSTAEQFADYFETVFTRNEDITNLPDIAAAANNTSVEDIIFTEEIVLQQLLKLSTTSSPGPDTITPYVLKTCASSLAKPLAHISQISFNTGKLPPAWLTASVTAVYKKGDKMDAANYRPISLTSICVKIMERIIVSQLVPFLLQSEVIPASQHGFVPGRSTVTNLLHCLNTWTGYLEMANDVDIIYLDFSKAFDRVPIHRLSYKLEHYGITGRLLNWIIAFLSDRSFSVRIGTTYSSPRSIPSGVPQGSVLGPVLFLIYVSDLSVIIQSPHTFYADDCKFFGNPNTDLKVLREDLTAIEHWCSQWLLPLNFDKCTVLHLGKNNPRHAYSFSAQTIKPVNIQVDLGITITSNLSWSEHTTVTVKKANSLIYILSRSFQELNIDTFNKLYKSYIRPVIEYGNSVWSPYLVRDVQFLESIQRRATRMVPLLRRNSYHQRLDALKITTLSERRMRGDLIETYKILHQHFSTPVHNMFTLNNDNRLRGHSLKLVREKFKTRQRQYFLPNRVFYSWNSLPEAVVSAPSVNTFKNRLDHHIVSTSGQYQY